MVCLHSHEFIHLTFLLRFHIILIVIITIIIISCFSLVLTFFFGFWFWGFFVIKIFFPIFLQKSVSTLLKRPWCCYRLLCLEKGRSDATTVKLTRTSKKAKGLITKTTTLHVQHTFRTFFVVAARLQRDIRDIRTTTTWHSWRFKEDVNISLSPSKLGCRQQSLRIQIQGKSPTFEILRESE